MFAGKSSGKLHAGLGKHEACRVGSCPALPGRNLISACDRGVGSVPAGRGGISSRQAGIM